MGVAEVIILRIRSGCPKVNRRKRNGLAQGILAAARDIGTTGDQHRILEEIVSRSVLLKDDQHVLNHCCRRQRQRLCAVAGANLLASLAITPMA